MTAIQTAMAGAALRATVAATLRVAGTTTEKAIRAATVCTTGEAMAGATVRATRRATWTTTERATEGTPEGSFASRA
jgi:hypothetical protein